MIGKMFPIAILAGGLAQRLRPLTAAAPKSLIELKGEPFIAHQLRLLRSKGFRRAVICAGYLGEMIQDAVGTGGRFGLEVDYSFDGLKLLGTAGALKAALPLLGQEFFVLYGDSYLPCDYSAVQAAFSRKGRLALMTVYENDGRYDRSNVKMEQGEIVLYDKELHTPAMHHIDYGLGVFRDEALTYVPQGLPFDLSRVYQDLLHKKQLAAYEVADRFYEIGSFAGLEEMRLYVEKGMAAEGRSGT